MAASLIDVDDVLKNMARESVKQGQNLRTTVRDLTLRALQTRELSLAHIKGVLRSITAGVNVGLVGSKVDVDKAVTAALAGMDEALLKAVQASAIALQKLGLAGEDFEQSKMKKALDDLDRLEDEFLKAIRQASGGASETIKAQWASVLKRTQLGGTEAGAKAAETVEAFGQRMQTAMREQRKESLRTAHRLSQNFGALASGVLMGLTEGLYKAGSAESVTRAKPRTSKPAARKPAARKPTAPKPAAPKRRVKKASKSRAPSRKRTAR
jgi:hypothetical protein